MATMRKAQRLPSARTKKPEMLPDDAATEPMDWRAEDMARELTLKHPRVVAIKARITRDLARVQAKHSKGAEDPMAKKKMDSPAMEKQEKTAKASKTMKKDTKKGSKSAKMPWMK
jgi:hypothetical protein